MPKRKRLFSTHFFVGVKLSKLPHETLMRCMCVFNFTDIIAEFEGQLFKH